MDNEIKNIKIGFLEVPVENINVEHMPNEIMKDIFEVCGRDVAISLLFYFQGNTIQVPTRPWIEIQNRYIIENYDGSAISIKRIARKLGTSEMNIRDVLKSKKYKNIPTKNQISIFDALKNLQEIK